MRGQKSTAEMAAALHPEGRESALEKYGGCSLEGLRTASSNSPYISLKKTIEAPAGTLKVEGRKIWDTAKQKEKGVE